MSHGICDISLITYICDRVFPSENEAENLFSTQSIYHMVRSSSDVFTEKLTLLQEFLKSHADIAVAD